MNTSPPVLPCLQKLNKENFSKKETNLNIDGWDCWFNKDIKSLPKIWPDHNKNKQTVGELWLGFLRYYTEYFDWDNNVVSIRSTDQLTKRSKNWTKHRLAIEDPFDTQKNLASRIKKNSICFIIQFYFKFIF